MKSKVLKCRVVNEVIDLITNLYRLGWDERNGGNVSYILDEKDVEKYVPKKTIRKIDLGFEAKELSGRYLLVTGTGKYFKNVKKDPETNLGIIRISENGKLGELVWGFVDGGFQTSEFPTHLMNHISRLKVDKDHHIVIHTHATNTLALSFVAPENEEEITKLLWKMMTECIVVFPEGIGYLPWMVCGNHEIGYATSLKAKDYRLVIWGMHGVFGMGKSVDEAFGLIETVEKACEIYFKVKDKTKQAITDEQLIELANAFKLNYKKII